MNAPSPLMPEQRALGKAYQQGRDEAMQEIEKATAPIAEHLSTMVTQTVKDALRAERSAERQATLKWVLDLYRFDFPCTQFNAPKCSHENWAQCLRHAIEAELKGEPK